ncbi:MAG: extracellular solute-binding protein, partial [Clostridia bacterium]|nr:extracellular solute-binding protein [Clostridia bacterium]
NEALTTYRYNGGVYAIPETMNFKVMFYRKDILSRYGIPIPDTRDQLYSKTLPALYREGFSFCYPRDDSEFILQYGGAYYTEDGKRSALDSAEVFAALKEETELYTQYAIPVTANFYNRFRTGEMPMGIGEYTMYLQLLSAAPEISGKWAVAPIPGMKNKNGDVDRSNAAFQCLSDVILSASSKKEQGWEFLKWWSSYETQLNFATEVEAVLGEEARWNTANTQAFQALPWKSEDLRVITEMLESDREVPVVLGGYYTTRYLTNAWNKVVNNGAVLRDELEDAVVNINKELRSKQEEYGVAGS